jgi:hypothetical protein
MKVENDIRLYRDWKTGELKYIDMENKTISIDVPEGYEIDKDKSTFEKIVFRALPAKKGLPKTWGELGLINGFYSNAWGNVSPMGNCNVGEMNKNTWPTKEEAEASMALAQLCQLRDRYNDGWKPNWLNPYETKYVMSFSGGEVSIHINSLTQRVLFFKTKEFAEEFRVNFKDLIEKAKPLL